MPIFYFVAIRLKKTPGSTEEKEKALANKMVKASSKAKEIDLLSSIKFYKGRYTKA